MRYEDASQTGSGQVDARNDADQLAARDYGTASGNVITGTGTVTGSAGLDMVDAGQGRITAIDGAGGSDSSFSGGKLSVQGQYGTLTIDARGNYTYDREAGTPEGVTDTFHYTLANKSGATDSARLVISFGEQPKLADATRVVPGPDGVVTLPPGVELSDIRVVGRDLVVTLPDGSLMVIVDGAIFVPQLVLGGVEVPATNLAALLIGSEPRPAAGDLVGPTNPSSGGNFEVPVAPLDPGVPLGDLLPPTELDYTPPEFEELGDILEDNDPPVIGTSAVNVSEEGVISVAAPNPDTTGSPDTTNSPSNSGILPVSDPDGDSLNVVLGIPSEALTSAGVPITWSVSPDGHTLTGSAGVNAVVTVVINDVGAYIVTLLRPVDHPNGGGEQGASFVVPVSVSDGEEITAGGAITVTIEDDSPTITGRIGEPILIVDDSTLGVNDTDSFSGAFLASFGADGAAAANAISYALGVTAGPSGIIDVATGEQVNLVMNGAVVEGRTATTNQLVFTVSVDGSGNVTLDQLRAVRHNDPADPVETGASAATLASDSLVTLSIVATDRDGDTASLSINIGQNLQFEDDGPDAVVNASFVKPVLIVDESPLPGAGDGDNSDTEAFAGAFGAVIDHGTDGAGSVSYQLLLSGQGAASGLYALDPTDTETAIDPLGQGAQILLYEIGGVIYGSTAANVGAVVPGNTYFTISTDSSGNVTLTRSASLNLWHDNTSDHDDPEILTAAANTVRLQQTVTDADGDSDTAQVDLSANVFRFEDDGPSTYEPQNASLTNAAGSPVFFDLDDPLQGGDDNILNNFGSDGPGTVRIALSIDNTDSGLTSGSVKIWYILDATGTVLLGRTGTSAANAEASGTTIFTITMDHANSRYSIDMNGTVDSFTTINFNDGTYDFIGGNDTWAGFVPDGQLEGDTPVNDDSDDLLLTPIGTGTAVNGNATSAGVTGDIAGQNIGMNEGMRLDFIEDLTGNPTPGDYNVVGEQTHDFDGHYLVNGASLQFQQGTSTLTTASFKAILVSPLVIDDNGDDGTPDLVDGTGVLVSVNRIVISYDGENQIVDFDPLDLDNTQTVTVGLAGGLADRTYTVEFVLDGATGEYYAKVTGIYDNLVRIATFADQLYNALEMLHLGPATPDADFAISGFGVVTQSPTPVLFSIPTEIVDADGDVVVGGDIDITLTPPPPPPPVVLDLDGDGVEFVDMSAGVAFDYGDGLVATAWSGADDGILVRDANGNGLVDDASEFVFGGNGQTDMEALHAQYGDQLDASDADFVMFAVWNDANSNGIADDGELSSLAEAGIASIGLVSDGIAYTAANGDVSVAGSSSFTRTDGSTGTAADAAFRTGSRVAVEADRVAANSNNVVLAAAVAAAGLVASTSAAASVETSSGTTAKSANPVQVSEVINLAQFGLSTETAIPALLGGAHGFGAVEMPFQSPGAFNFGNSSIGELGGGGFDASAPMSLSQGSDFVSSPIAMPMMASNVAMPSAEALAAMAGLDAGRSAVSLESIVANALQGGGGPDIDSLLSALPSQGIGADAGLDALASLGNGTVPSWDMGQGAGFTFAGPNAITTEALVLHHDAIQPIANG